MSEWQSARPAKGRMANPELVDRLPPHSEEAERGVLGCVLLDFSGADRCLEKMAVAVQSAEMFYDLRHRVVFAALLALRAAGKPPDLIVLGQWLEDRGELQECGGLVYLSGLPDDVPSVANLDYYLAILREKFVLRKAIAVCTETVGRLFEYEGTLQPELDRLEKEVGQLQRARQDPNSRPVRIKRPGEYGEQVYNLWFGTQEEEPGMWLPDLAFGKFPFKIRPQETTFFLGEKGNGKSTLLLYMLLHLAMQGAKVIVASMETPAPVTIQMLMMQLLGTGKLPDNDFGHKEYARAMAWLNDRFFIYEYLGIAEWRPMQNDFAHTARQFGATVGAVDSVMRLGIRDDDYAEQGQAAIGFSGLATSCSMHLFIVNHLNKSDGKTTSRSRGSQQWIDNSNNVVSVERNEKKHKKLSELQALARNELEYEQAVAGMREDWLEKGDWWDAYFALHYQRWPRSQQNGSRHLFFRRNGLQYFRHEEQGSVNWLDRKNPYHFDGTPEPPAPNTEPQAVQTSLLEEGEPEV